MGLRGLRDRAAETGHGTTGQRYGTTRYAGMCRIPHLIRTNQTRFWAARRD